MEMISPAMWTKLTGIDTVLLHGNMLSTLPESITKINSSIRELSLYDNPWNCSCENRWLIEYLITFQQRLLRSEKIICSSPETMRGRALLRVIDDKFCHSHFVIVFSIFVSLVCGGFLFSIGIICFHRCRMRLYTSWNIHPFDRNECDEDDMTHDVFICCAFGDCKYEKDVLSFFFDSRGYKGCYHERDFFVGELIEENICKAIYNSKRTLCLLSDNLIRSEYCMREFEVALQRDVDLGKKRLIVAILQKAAVENKEMCFALRHYLSSHTYLECSSKYFQTKLLYAMPVKELMIALLKILLFQVNLCR